MKTYIQNLFIALALFAGVCQAVAQGTAFTYQGQLQNNGSPASGSYNLTFTLFNTNASGVAVAVPVTNNAVFVTSGLFTVLIDFGSDVWNGQTNWLQIEVETNNGSSSFSTLTPRQELTPIPYAITAENFNGTVPLTQLPASVVTTNETSVTLSNVTVTGDLDLPAATSIYFGGTPLFNTSPDNFFAGSDAGNSTMSGLGNIGFGDLALRNDTSGGNNTANGFNALGSNMTGSDNTASGEIALFNNSSGSANTAYGVSALYGNSTGGNNTAVGVDALEGTYPIPMTGSFNTAVGAEASGSDITGAYNTANGYQALYSNTNGSYNTASGYHALYLNTSGSDNAANSRAGLYSNTIGSYNTADGDYALNNNASGSNNVALGYQAGYNVLGSSNIDIGNEGLSTDTNIIRIGSGQSQTFIAGVITNTSTLALQAGADMDLTADNDMSVTANKTMNLNSDTTIGLQSGSSMTVQSGASMQVQSVSTLQVVAGSSLSLSGTQLLLSGGNVGIGTNAPAYPLEMGSGAYCSVAGVWTSVSDRNAKENFIVIKPAEVLAKVTALPITEWKYKVEADGIEHIGPMAQDFHAAFGLNGTDDKHISTVDESGVALAAIQGLNQKLEETRIENAALKRQNDLLAKQLNELEVEVKSLAETK